MIPHQGSTFNKYIIEGVSLLIVDRPNSRSGSWIADELAADQYGLEKISFLPGEFVVDVGAHIGMFSIYLAIKFPMISIFAFEPEPTNFNNLLINLALNKITNVVACNMAITADARLFSLKSPAHNSGGAGGFHDNETRGTKSTVASETLDGAFERNGITKCKLLKMDCEGAEHEVLLNAACLSGVEWLSIEIHMNRELRRLGHSRDRLVSSIRERIPVERLTFSYNELG